MEEGGSGYNLTVLGSPTQLSIDPDLKETHNRPSLAWVKLHALSPSIVGI